MRDFERVLSLPEKREDHALGLAADEYRVACVFPHLPPAFLLARNGVMRELPITS